MTELYLIAHKVRGEPAFDIATRIAIGDEEGWIIPTSGHRAYPWWWSTLSNLRLSDDDITLGNEIEYTAGTMPANLEDHYPARASTDAPKPSAASLLAQLGLGKPKVTIQRRV